MQPATRASWALSLPQGQYSPPHRDSHRPHLVQNAAMNAQAQESRSAAPSVLLIHGAGQDGRAWRFQRRALRAAGIGHWCPDLPGHGRSQQAPVDSVAQAALALHQGLMQQAPTRWVVVGHSMGSLVALHLAARLGEQAVALVLVGTACPMRVSPALLELAQQDPEAAMRNIAQYAVARPQALAGQAQPDAHAQARAQRLRTHVLQLMQSQAKGVLYRDLLQCDQEDSAVQQAASVSCPVHMVAGDFDKMTPAAAAEPLAQAFAHCPAVHRHVLPCGHSIMAEAPRALLEVIRFAASPGRS